MMLPWVLPVSRTHRALIVSSSSLLNTDTSRMKGCWVLPRCYGDLVNGGELWFTSHAYLDTTLFGISPLDLSSKLTSKVLHSSEQSLDEIPVGELDLGYMCATSCDGTWPGFKIWTIRHHRIEGSGRRSFGWKRKGNGAFRFLWDGEVLFFYT